MDKAVGLAAKILDEHPLDVEELTIVPGSGGVFDVHIDGTLIFSKKKQGRFPQEGEIEKHLSA